MAALCNNVIKDGKNNAAQKEEAGKTIQTAIKNL